MPKNYYIDRYDDSSLRKSENTSNAYRNVEILIIKFDKPQRMNGKF